MTEFTSDSEITLWINRFQCQIWCMPCHCRCHFAVQPFGSYGNTHEISGHALLSVSFSFQLNCNRRNPWTQFCIQRAWLIYSRHLRCETIWKTNNFDQQHQRWAVGSNQAGNAFGGCFHLPFVKCTVSSKYRLVQWSKSPALTNMNWIRFTDSCRVFWR